MTTFLVRIATDFTYAGYFNDLGIEITTKSDVIIIVNLPRALPVPVHLVIVYRDLENLSLRPDKKITQAAYLNTSVIRHIDFASQVPFEHFSVEVGLFSLDEFGPLNRAQGEYGEQLGHHLNTSTQSVTLTYIIFVSALVLRARHLK